ncbi:MAG: fasciclin domain-containing protein, partial [Candidatus Poseidoniaceae archaeon]|nr:fasciclin domain-containing protein [Candidatus Poseidoniaceae archaeon]
LVAAVIQAELLTTLQGEGPFTLFAPTDQAFADAGIDLATLDTPEGKAALTDILLYHVHSGSVSAADITEGMNLQMVNGDNATFSLVGQASIDGANITLADVLGSNGVIHVIDKVLMPPAEEVEDSSDDASSSSDDDSSLLFTVLLVVLVVLGGGVAVVLFMRNRGTGGEALKDLTPGGIMNQLQTVNPAEYASQPVQAYQPVQAVQPVQAYQPVQAVQPILTVEVIPQVVAEPVVLRQWTDENGYTWRAMDNQETYWWTGTEWQKYG